MQPPRRRLPTRRRTTPFASPAPDLTGRFLASSHGGQVAAGRSVLAGSPLTASAPCPPAVFADLRPNATDECQLFLASSYGGRWRRPVRCSQARPSQLAAPCPQLAFEKDRLERPPRGVHESGVPGFAGINRKAEAGWPGFARNRVFAVGGTPGVRGAPFPHGPVPPASHLSWHVGRGVVG